ncbi:MAG TPA: nucleotide exchange factor GrpE [Saprospiraceae bacterium]|nr:nucleotide exchange factor GrpE [Saprospiraceae bacterium]HMQ83806.1 nucleotide exchange factor GrpE [Saprospiraceae bacterium]
MDSKNNLEEIMENPSVEDHPEIEETSAEVDSEQAENQQDTPDELEESKAQEGDSHQQITELKDKYLRLFAEFDNYKKRTIKEKLDMMNTAAQDTLTALLPILDDFDRAKKNAEMAGAKETFSEGVNLVYQKLYGALRQRGLEPMASDGEPFDPEFHEAVTKIPAPTEEMKGKVIDTIEKGYKLNDKIIRYAKVVVGE